MDEEKRKKFRAIQGGLPPETQMRRELPGLFKNLKLRLEAVKDIDTVGIEVTKEMLQRLELQLGSNIERYLFNK